MKDAVKQQLKIQKDKVEKKMHVALDNQLSIQIVLRDVSCISVSDGKRWTYDVNTVSDHWKRSEKVFGLTDIVSW